MSAVLVGFAALNLAMGVHGLLARSVGPWTSALSFGAALFCTIIALTTDDRQ